MLLVGFPIIGIHNDCRRKIGTLDMKFGLDAPCTKVEWYKDGDVHVKKLKVVTTMVCYLQDFSNMIL